MLSINQALFDELVDLRVLELCVLILRVKFDSTLEAREAIADGDVCHILL